MVSYRPKSRDGSISEVIATTKSPFAGLVMTVTAQKGCLLFSEDINAVDSAGRRSYSSNTWEGTLLPEKWSSSLATATPRFCGETGSQLPYGEHENTERRGHSGVSHLSEPRGFPYDAFDREP